MGKDSSTSIVSDLLTLLKNRAEEAPEATALETALGSCLTYRDLHARVHANASMLAAGQVAGRPRIGIVMPNGMDMAVTLLSAACAGAALPFNPANRASELRTYFHDTRVDVLITGAGDQGDADTVARELGIPVHRVAAGGILADATTERTDVPAIDADDVALVLLTSGSTGRPKAVPLSHRNVLTSSFDVGRSMALGPKDRCLSMWEQYHVGGLVDLLMAPLSAGGTVICTPGFDASVFFDLVQTTRPTWFQGVPTTLNELVLFAQRKGLSPDVSSLRLVRSVAAPLSPKLMTEVENLFQKPVLQTYGMTEAGPLITSTGLAPGSRKPGSVGASCGCEVRVTDTTGNPVEAGVEGPLSIRGPNVFSGYENDPEANATQFRDGWFFTGDIGYIDTDGDLFITGRIKQLINRGGEKINPQEVDDALLAHPSIGAVASFSVPHRTLGEDIAAAVVVRDGHTASEAELKTHLAEQLAAFKVPGRVYFFKDLPRNAIGKIDRLAVSVAALAQDNEGKSAEPARDDLERFLADLWCAELDLDGIGIGDDFGRSGGDSFSSMRILTAIDRSLGYSAQESELAALNTIRAMAGWLRENAPGGTAEKRDLYLEDRLNAARAEEAVEALDYSLASTVLDEYEAESAIGKAASPMDFEIATDALLMYPTPSEVRALLERYRGLPGPEMRLWIQNPRNMIRIQLRRNKRVRQLREALRGDGSMYRWERRPICEHAILYGDPGVPEQSKALVVCFTGNAMRPMMSSHCFLSQMDPDQYDLLLLRDPERNHYKYGVEGLGDTIQDIADTLADMAHDYRRPITLGISAGGLASIVVARRNGWSKAVAIGPDSPQRHPIMLSALQEPARGDTRILVAYGQGYGRDNDAAVETSKTIPQATLRSVAGMDHHNILYEMYCRGDLDTFLTDVFAEADTGETARPHPE